MEKLDDKLLEILICPNCSGELQYDQKNNQLICHQSQLAYPIKNGIPIMLIDEAEKLPVKNEK